MLLTRLTPPARRHAAFALQRVTMNLGIGEAAIGVIWLVNTLVIVALQMPISRLAEGRRRMRALAAMGATWAVAWLLVGAGGAWFSTFGATVVLALALGVFGVGECPASWAICAVERRPLNDGMPMLPRVSCLTISAGGSRSTSGSGALAPWLRAPASVRQAPQPFWANRVAPARRSAARVAAALGFGATGFGAVACAGRAPGAASTAPATTAARAADQMRETRRSAGRS